MPHPSSPSGLLARTGASFTIEESDRFGPQPSLAVIFFFSVLLCNKLKFRNQNEAYRDSSEPSPIHSMKGHGKLERQVRRRRTTTQTDGQLNPVWQLWTELRGGEAKRMRSSFSFPFGAPINQLCVLCWYCVARSRPSAPPFRKKSFFFLFSMVLKIGFTPPNSQFIVAYGGGGGDHNRSRQSSGVGDRCQRSKRDGLQIQVMGMCMWVCVWKEMEIIQLKRVTFVFEEAFAGLVKIGFMVLF